MSRIKFNSIESSGTENRTLPVDGLRWLEAGLPNTSAFSGDGSLTSGYLPNGFHLALPQTFRVDPPKIEELNTDGTFAGDFYNPPHPFTRRMWASGEYTFHKGRRISLGKPLYVRSRVVKSEGKDLSGSEPKVFCTRRFEWGSDPRLDEPAITEDRTHVFLTASHQRVARPGTYVCFPWGIGLH
jgi:hydroxyacyl-ACP dehydratase HTD2-like protein with hotdog domain